jgi:hypothetical protein
VAKTIDFTKHLQDLMFNMKWIKVPQGVLHSLFGPRILREYWLNKKKEWSLPSSKKVNLSSTSASDSHPYNNICDAAYLNEYEFSNFKSEVNYKSILEHTGYNHGRRYLKVLTQRGMKLPKEFLSTHSSLGNPETFSFPELGRISPSLLRYLKVASDFDLHFPNWRGQELVEIGVGYGGQLAVLKELGHEGKYIGIDLKSAARLASKYVSSFGKYSQFSFNASDGGQQNLQGHHFISNYAFSELRPEVQEQYFDNFVKYSASGYVTWNDFSEKSLGGMTAESFRKRVGGQIFPEQPQTYPGNCIILWGHAYPNP